jgi:hypothetical protein
MTEQNQKIAEWHEVGARVDQSIKQLARSVGGLAGSGCGPMDLSPIPNGPTTD